MAAGIFEFVVGNIFGLVWNLIFGGGCGALGGVGSSIIDAVCRIIASFDIF